MVHCGTPTTVQVMYTDRRHTTCRIRIHMPRGTLVPAGPNPILHASPNTVYVFPALSDPVTGVHTFPGRNGSWYTSHGHTT